MSEEERWRRLDRVRLAIWAELLIGLLVTLLTGFAFISFPGYMGFHEPSLLEGFPAGPVIALVGFFWMVRLSRPRPEAGEPTWRYHDRAA